MRWLSWALMAGWVGVHAALWSEWPPSPRFVFPADSLSSLVGFTDDGRSLVTANGTGVRIRDAASGELRAEWADPNPDRKRLTHYLSPHGHTTTAVRNPDRLAALDIDSGEWTELRPAAAKMYGKDADKLFWPHDNAGLSADGQMFAYAAGVPETNSFVVRVWDLQKRAAFEIPLEQRGFSAALAPDGRSLAVCVDGGAPDPSHVLVVDAQSRREIGRMTMPPAYLRWIQFSPDGQTLAAMSYDPTSAPPDGAGASWVKLWDTSARKLIATIQGNGFAAWTGDGRLLLPTRDRLNAFDGRSGAEIPGWNPPGVAERSFFRGTFARGQVAVCRIDPIHVTVENWRGPPRHQGCYLVRVLPGEPVVAAVIRLRHRARASRHFAGG